MIDAEQIRIMNASEALYSCLSNESTALASTALFSLFAGGPVEIQKMLIARAIGLS